METIKVIEPRVNVKSDVEKNHIVLFGGQRVNDTVIPADSWGSPGLKPVSMQFSISPPSTTTIVDRNIRFKTYWEIETDQDLQIGTNDALRAFPMASLSDVVTVEVNGASISDNTSDSFHALKCFGDNPLGLQDHLSTTPVKPDAYQQYSDWTVYGSGKNPLAEYGESDVDPRGGFPIEVLTARRFRVAIVEPLFMSPFLSGLAQQEEGFVNVNQLNITVRWKTDLSQILSHSSAGNAITTVTVSMYQQPEALVTFITPDLTQQLPRLQVLPYFKPQPFLKPMALMPDNTTTTVVSDSIKLALIPRKLYLFCRHQRSSSDFKTSDSFLKIERLRILWNNQNALFGSANSEQLYEISRQNGLNLSYPQWAKHRGSVMCIEFGKDIGLLDNEAPGVSGGQWTIQVEMDVRNVSGADFIPEFYQIFMLEGTFSVAENMGRASIGNLTHEIVLNARMSEEMDYHDYHRLRGGSFWSSLKNFVNKVARGVQKGVEFGQKIAPVAVAAFPELAPVAAALPAVGQIASGVRHFTGGRMSGGRMSGGGQMAKGRRSMRRM